MLLVPGISCAIVNYSMTINYLSTKYINDQKPISLSEQFTFKNYNITQFCYAVRLSNVTTDEASPQNEKSSDGQLVQMAS